MSRHYKLVPTISDLKLLSRKHRILLSFSEHTGSILQNSEHIFMSSQSRGYPTMQTELDTHFMYVCCVFFFGKTKLLLVI